MALLFQLVKALLTTAQCNRARLTGLFLLLLLSLLAGCSSMYFMPMKPWVQNPAKQGLAYEDIVLLHPHGRRIHGWWLPAKGSARGTVYFLHGNAQNISTHLMNVAWLPAAGFNVFLLDYRGYGLSEGKPNLVGAMDDIQLGLDWLRGSGRSTDKPLVVFAQSLGGSMVLPVLTEEKNHGRYDCLMIEAAFSSYRQVVDDIMASSWLLWPLRPLVVPFQPRKFDAVDVIASLRAPLLVLHSDEDEVVPFKHGEQLFAAAAEPKEFQRLHGAHIASLRDPDVRQRLLQFTEQHCGVSALVTKPPAETKTSPAQSQTPQLVKPPLVEPIRDPLRGPPNKLSF